MLGTLKQRFSLKRCFLLPKCFPNINVAYKRCYFPQTLFSGQNVAKKCCKPPLNVVVSQVRFQVPTYKRHIARAID
jgi:hypothetical protein